MFWVMYYIIPRGTKGVGGNEDIVISMIYQSYCGLHEETNEDNKGVWSTFVKQYLLWWYLVHWGDNI